MRRKIQLICLLGAWLLATGGQWDLVQTFAWGRMFVTYAQVMPFNRALSLTFEPDNLCSVCKLVKEAKQQQEQSPVTAGRIAEKILLVFEPVPKVVVACPSFSPWSPSDQIVLSAQRAAPPVPPPRVSAA